MANIYEDKTEAIHQLLDRARTDDGATVLIPDLQRPYVWTPSQVSLLVDSLIRGWPFGTLLMWKVSPGDIQNIPHRPFWRIVDRTKEADGTSVIAKDPPAAYHMVLDGQQRVQSLLLALGGDGWGFRLEDRDWAQELRDRRPRGPSGKFRHWSKASLCFDLDAFLSAYHQARHLHGVEFSAVLKWAITDPTAGQSTWPKPPTYEEPVPCAYRVANRTRLIRLSRLWSAVIPNPNLRESQFQAIARDLFAEHGVPAEKIEQLRVPIGELMATLRDVKLSKISYLELLPFDKQVWEEGDYNDAIVSIFTRLNTAGRTLTREEITLAWLKVGWQPELTGGKPAGECFRELLDDLSERGLTVEIDGMVGAVSLIWSVCCNNGQLLTNRDLLRGATIRPMASALALRWSHIRRAVITGLDAVRDRGLQYGQAGQYSSLNALAVVWAWLYIAFQWEAQQNLTVLQRDAFEKKLESTLASMLDRWLICSQWAGRWSGASAPAAAGYARDLHEDFQACAELAGAEAVHDILDERFLKFVRSLELDASAHIDALTASSRERVSLYRTALWVWHRLDATRWEMSKISLRTGRGKPSTDVDHVVAFALWKQKITDQPLAAAAEQGDPLLLINLLGNCSLLEKTFNISRSDRPLRSFMQDVHELKIRSVEFADWARALALRDSLLDPDLASVAGIVKEIQSRDETIRAELREFVIGAKSRADL